jgi:hypothetical protein
MAAICRQQCPSDGQGIYPEMSMPGLVTGAMQGEHRRPTPVSIGSEHSHSRPDRTSATIIPLRPDTPIETFGVIMRAYSNVSPTRSHERHASIRFERSPGEVAEIEGDGENVFVVQGNRIRPREFEEAGAVGEAATRAATMAGTSRKSPRVGPTVRGKRHDPAEGAVDDVHVHELMTPTGTGHRTIRGRWPRAR